MVILSPGLVTSFPGPVISSYVMGFELARVDKPIRFRKYDSGYLTWGNGFDNPCAAFNYPVFLIRMLSAKPS